MTRKQIPDNVKRRLWAESMGRCMNPDCLLTLFINDKDIAEQAHIVPYNKTQDNTFENLVILCPNCHTTFDKVNGFDINNIKNWRKIRQEEVEKYFNKKYSSFEELEENIVPLLNENREIYENYFLGGNKSLWEKFEYRLLFNNEKIKNILEKNMGLIQKNRDPDYSNQAIVSKFISHIREFSATRNSKERNRQILYPLEIASIFGIKPISEHIIPSAESLEKLIKKLNDKGIFRSLDLTIRHPYIEIIKGDKIEKIFLNDTPRLRQHYANYGAFCPTNVRLESLIYIMRYIRSRKINFVYEDNTKIKEILVNNIKIIFVYEYCLSKAFLEEMLPDENSIIVNLYNWNVTCISSEAYDLASKINITLLDLNGFYGYIDQLR